MNRRALPKKKPTKEQVPQHRFKEAQVLAVVNKGQNEKEKTYFHKTGTRRHSFWTLKNLMMKNNLGLFLEVALSYHCSLWLSFLPLFISLLNADTSRD